MKKDLIKLANHLDSKGLTKEADYVDGLVKSASLGGQTYYILCHIMSYEEGAKILGIYSSLEQAKAVIAEVKDKAYRDCYFEIEEASFEPSIETVIDGMFKD